MRYGISISVVRQDKPDAGSGDPFQGKVCHDLRMQDQANIRPEFASHQLTDHGTINIDAIKQAFSVLLDEIERDVPAGRERASVVTKLQEACMFAVRGVAVAKENQKQYENCP